MVMVVVVTVVVILSCGSERRAGKHHQDQEKRCCENLFHALNVARFAKAVKACSVCGIKRGNRRRVPRMDAGDLIEAFRFSRPTKE
jgi:hypothetical protein